MVALALEADMARDPMVAQALVADMARDPMAAQVLVVAQEIMAGPALVADVAQDPVAQVLARVMAAQVLDMVLAQAPEVIDPGKVIFSV